MNRLNARTKTFETLSAARAHALAISIKFPREYVAIINVFGWMVTRRTRLNTFASILALAHLSAGLGQNF